MKTTFTLLASITILSLLGFVSCKKEEETSNSKLTVKMVDAPGDFQEVNIEVKQVEVHHSAQGWITLPTNVGIYDLLTLQNDVSATLVNIGSLPAGHIDEFRLILGSGNYVKVDDAYFSLATPSAQQSGLKINVNSDFAPNQEYQLLIDFDAENSIVTQGNGSYSLKPVIKLVSVIPV